MPVPLPASAATSLLESNVRGETPLVERCRAVLPLDAPWIAACMLRGLRARAARARCDQGGHGVTEQRVHLSVGVRAVCIPATRAVFPAAGAGSCDCVDDAGSVNSIHLRLSQAVGESAPVVP
eukprot:1045026-Prymnesium_polylepis.2